MFFRHAAFAGLVLGCFLFAVASPAAQEGKPPALDQGVPRVIPVNGRVTDGSGRPATGQVKVTFRVYAAADAVDPIWSETGTVQLDETGAFSVIVGAKSTGGVPAEIFALGEARWLGYSAEGRAEATRSRILSVPYALKALDAAMLGGRPASDYVLASEAESRGGEGWIRVQADTKSIKGEGTANTIAKFIAVDTIADSVIHESAGRIGIGTTTPVSSLDLVAVGGVGVRATLTGTGGVALDGVSTAANGIGVRAVAGGTGTNFGLSAATSSASGVAGAFTNHAGGTLILGLGAGGVEKFRVDGSGNLFANALFNLSGSPLGSGTVTSVGTGTGLTGGSITAAGTLSLDTAFTDARYAMLAHGHLVADVIGAATLGANTFTATQTIDSGNLDLDPSTATAGNISKNGVRFIHNFSGGTFVGANAGSFSATGNGNTGIGDSALRFLTSGSANTALGISALNSTGLGTGNVGVGFAALSNNTNGGSNVAVGLNALRNSGSGSNNTGVGRHAGDALTSGDGNVMVGANAGLILTSGSLNVYLAHSGVATESNTTRIGEAQTRAFISGVRGVTTVNPDAIPVMIDSAGQLGTVSSSRRFKEDIRDMADASQRLFQLRPVTFRYAQAYGNGSKPIQFGLVAEEVAQLFPELAVRNPDGQVETVHYETLNVLLLNELQKQQKRIEELERKLNDVLKAVAAGTARRERN